MRSTEKLCAEYVLIQLRAGTHGISIFTIGNPFCDPRPSFMYFVPGTPRLRGPREGWHLARPTSHINSAGARSDAQARRPPSYFRSQVSDSALDPHLRLDLGAKAAHLGLSAFVGYADIPAWASFDLGWLKTDFWFVVRHALSLWGRRASEARGKIALPYSNWPATRSLVCADPRAPDGCRFNISPKACDRPAPTIAKKGWRGLGSVKSASSTL